MRHATTFEPGTLHPEVRGMEAEVQRHALAASVRDLRRSAGAVTLPSPLLPGWQALCAEEYARAASLLHTRVARLEALLAEASTLLGS